MLAGHTSSARNQRLAPRRIVGYCGHYDLRNFRIDRSPRRPPLLDVPRQHGGTDETLSVARPTQPNRIRRVLVGVALALLALVVFITGSVQAACTLDASVHMDSLDHFPLLRSHGAMDPGAAAAPLVPPSNRPADQPGNCSGPSCSRRSGSPASQTTVGSSRAGQWALLVNLPAPKKSQPSRRLDHAIDSRPIRIAEPIFHPPQLSALTA